VVSALYGAAGHPEAPRLGKARFHVTPSNRGAVEVTLDPSSDPFEGWRSVALKAAEALRRKPPRIPSGRAGARLVIDLVAEDALPNGVKAKSLHGPRVSAAAPRLQSTDVAKRELEERNPTAATGNVPLTETLATSEVPGLYVSGQNAVCDYNAGVTPLGTLQAGSSDRQRQPGLEFRIQGGCDPAQIGAKPRRTVRATVRDEPML
jgi:hypothetical protein